MQAAWVTLVKVSPNRWEGHELKPWIEAARKRLHHNVLAIALANKLRVSPGACWLVVEASRRASFRWSNHSRVVETFYPPTVCEKRDGGSVFPAHANTGDPNGPREACPLMRSQAR